MLRILLLCALARLALAGVYCNGMLTQPHVIEGDVYVTGTACLIRGVKVGGVVYVRDGGVLRTDGGAYFEGSIIAEGHGNIFLLGSTKLIGDVQLSNPLPGAVFIVGPHADINKIGIMGPTDVLLRGRTGALAVEWGANVVLAGHIGGGGFLLEGGNGTLVLCDADVGGMKISEMKGQILAWARPNCKPSNITGSMSVEKGAGLVKIVRNNLDAGDLSVIEQDGNVVIEDTTVGDMGISDVSGTITMKHLVADSDGIVSGSLKGITIIESEINGDFLVGHNTGNVVIEDSKIGGDVAIEQTHGNVVLKRNVANYAMLAISRTFGEVHFYENSQLSVSIVENMNVYFKRNKDIRTADIQKNTGRVVIKNNYVGTMKCLANEIMAEYSYNTVTGIASGQCRV